jgi:hypothetical protein
MGFNHEITNIRQYIFQGVISDGTRKAFLVTTDVGLLTKYHIQLQEVPMMCLRLLELSAETEPLLDLLVLTEADMLTHVRTKAADKELAALKRPKRPFAPKNTEPLDVIPRA